jgi:hypothetical protein
VRAAPDNSFVCILGDDTYSRVFHIASSYTSDVVVYGVEWNRAEVPAKVVRACAIGNHTNSVESVNFDKKTMIVATGAKKLSVSYFPGTIAVA